MKSPVFLALSLAGCAQVISSTDAMTSPDVEVAGDGFTEPDALLDAGDVSDVSLDVVDVSDVGNGPDQGNQPDASVQRPLRHLSAGSTHVCVARDGRVTCAGGITAGMVGYDPNGRERPVSVPGRVVGIASTADTACALVEAGEVYCWGTNDLGLGGDISRVAEPTVATVTGAESISRSVGFCALGPRGANCWGHDPSSMMLGQTVSPTALEVISNTAMLAPGGMFYCMLGADRRVRCRGYNDRGQCGVAPSQAFVPLTLISVLDDVVEVRAGFNTVCGLRASGQLACWGGNDFGLLGNGLGGNRETPRDVMGLEGVTQFDLSSVNVCARRNDGTIWCWGPRGAGLLGDGIRIADRDSPDFAQPTPFRVPGLDHAVEVAVGAGVACALRDDQSVWCWGYNFLGGLPWPMGTVSRPVQLIAPP